MLRKKGAAGDEKMRRDEEMRAEESQGGLWGTDVKI